LARVAGPVFRLLVFIAAAGVGASGCASRYASTGVVLRVEAPPSGEVTISHDTIPGYMHSMAMSFPVRAPATLKGIAPGDRVSFRLRVDRRASWIDRLDLISAARPDAGLVRSPSHSTLIPIGGASPDFTLQDQHGRPVSLASLRGQAVAVTFIYTRCPLPDYCPRLLTNFKEVRLRFADRIGRDVTLLTVTFDPTFDTVDVLRSFAQAQGADMPGWHFLTGPLPEITRICETFGIEFWPDEGLMSHTMQTAVLDREGRLAATVEGKGYDGRQLGDLIASVLARE
jgi:protein SCO1/2